MDNNKRLLIKKDIFENNNNGCNNNGDLFLKIWRNVIIRKEILKYMGLFKIHRFKMIFSSVTEIDQYPFKEFLCNVQLGIPKRTFQIPYLHQTMEINDFLEFKLPSSVSVLTIIDYNREYSNGFCRYIRPSSIPSSVKVLNFIKQDDYIKSSKFCNLAPTIDSGDIINLNNNNNNNNNNFGNNYFISDDNNNIYLENEISAYVISNGEQLIPFGVQYLNYQFNLEERSNFVQFNNLPNTVKILEIKRKIPSKFKNEDPICFLPNSIKKLSFDLITMLKPNFLPQSITELYLGNADNVYTSFKYNSNHGNDDDDNDGGCHSNGLIEKGILPQQLRKLNLGGYSNEIRIDVLPPTLTSLTLCTTYNKTIKPGCLPESLQYLSFQGDTIINRKNYDIDGFPHKKQSPSYSSSSSSSSLFSISSFFLKVSDLVNGLNQQQCFIEGSIPIGLKILKLSNYQPYEDILVKDILTPSHNSLTSISIVDFNSNYFESVENLKHKIQQRLKKLKKSFFIPSSVKKFVGSFEYCNQEIVSFLPFTKVKNISVNSNFQNLSSSIKSLSFRYLINCSMVSLPNTITSLSLGGHNLDENLTNLFPESLTYLDLTDDLFCSVYSKPLPTSMPKGLKTLILGSHYYSEINFESILPNLITLVVGKSSPKLVLPSSSTTTTSTTINLKEIIVFNSNTNFLKCNLPKLQSFIKVYNHSIKKKDLKKSFLSD
ncbi:hypothetical protein ACTA71_011624 [Dictyostelium dimigraforme]